MALSQAKTQIPSRKQMPKKTRLFPVMPSGAIWISDFYSSWSLHILLACPYGNPVVLSHSICFKFFMHEHLFIALCSRTYIYPYICHCFWKSRICSLTVPWGKYTIAYIFVVRQILTVSYSLNHWFCKSAHWQLVDSLSHSDWLELHVLFFPPTSDFSQNTKTCCSCN